MKSLKYKTNFQYNKNLFYNNKTVNDIDYCYKHKLYKTHFACYKRKHIFYQMNYPCLCNTTLGRTWQTTKSVSLQMAPASEIVWKTRMAPSIKICIKTANQKLCCLIILRKNLYNRFMEDIFWTCSIFQHYVFVSSFISPTEHSNFTEPYF